nr:hypothetical protein [Sediminibacillus massiliensis]
MQRFYFAFFLFLTVIAFFLNILGFMRLIPILITLPLLFFSIYFTLFSLTYRKTFRGFPRKN